MSTKKLLLPTTPEELQAELDKLRAENEALKKNEGGVKLTSDAPIVGGASVPVNRTMKVIHQQDQKGEKIASTTRCDMGFDPNQRFAGRQP